MLQIILHIYTWTKNNKLEKVKRSKIKEYKHVYIFGCFILCIQDIIYKIYNFGQIRNCMLKETYISVIINANLTITLYHNLYIHAIKKYLFK